MREGKRMVETCENCDRRIELSSRARGERGVAGLTTIQEGLIDCQVGKARQGDLRSFRGTGDESGVELRFQLRSSMRKAVPGSRLIEIGGGVLAGAGSVVDVPG